MFSYIYKKIILKYPKIILFLMTSLVLIISTFAVKLEIDASADTLLLKGDKDLAFTREVAKRFKTPNLLVVTYSIDNNLLSDKNIQNIKLLSAELLQIKEIESINNILNVPLLQSPIKPLKELMKNIPTLETPNIDKNLVKQEFLTSPIYKQNLVSQDFKTTAISLNLKDIQNREENHKMIVNIRDTLQKFEITHQGVKLHLGGVNMISDDMVEFVKSDLKTFGWIILLLLVVILYILFRKVQWIFITLIISGVSLVVTSGIFGFLGWQITVISANFISLQLIMNISLIVHLIIKYKELLYVESSLTQKELVYKTVTTMLKPSFFVVITTIAGFSSLVFSNILPIINFGWMMSVGIVVSLVVTFILFPTILLQFKKYKIIQTQKDNVVFTTKIAKIAYKYKRYVLAITLVIFIFSISGAYKIRVENSFIDYFKKDTQIYQGMKLIDQKLGGTTPLDIIITFKEGSDVVESLSVAPVDDEELDEFADEFAESAEDKKQYWFTQAKMQKIKQVHNYLASQKAIGKVLSLHTMGEILKTLNDSKEVDGFTLSVLYNELPPKYKKMILTPYLDIDKNQVRISTRVIDSMANLKRDRLIKQIEKDLKNMLNPKYEKFQISNLLVIYNNMLQSLFNSQIKTIGVVVLILFAIFLVLFKSLKVAIIAIIVNTIPVGTIFGFMGYFNIPLDMMTITIAAISIGIAVDNTIHYIYRYSLEFKQTKDAKKAMFASHASIGKAMFYTSLIIMIGFCILVLSSFIPTIYFGLLTMIAMFMAILADLLLLPVLLLQLNLIRGKK